MRFIHSLQVLAAFAYVAASIPAPIVQHVPVATEHANGLIDTVRELTETRLDLRDVALDILQRASALIKRSDDASELDKRWNLYSRKPQPQPGIPTRDESAQIAQLLAQLEQSFAELAHLISEQLGIPIPTAIPTPPTAMSTVTPSMQPDAPISTSLLPLTTPQAQGPITTSLGPPVLSGAPSSSSFSLGSPVLAEAPSSSSPSASSVFGSSGTTSLGSPVLAGAPSSSPPSASSVSSSSSTASTYTFNPNRPDLNVVYYAQSPATGSVPFMSVCSDPSVDIIILAFVTDFFTAGGYPTLNLGPECWALDPSTSLGAAAEAKGATGLIDCISPGFAGQVAQCQATGKKVMLSLGGAQGYSNTAIPSQQAAAELANTLWSLFLGGTDPNITPLRPFGSVTLDGIDIDNETPANAANFPFLTSQLRSLFAASQAAGSKSYYLSAAPQCPRPDPSILVPQMLPNLDFVNVQFYNNPSCNLGTSGFISSLQAWSSDVATYGSFQSVGNGLAAPRLLIGAPADPAAASAGGYVSQATWMGILQQVKGLGLGNLGGAMFWDGSYLELDKTGGQTFADVVRSVF